MLSFIRDNGNVIHKDTLHSAMAVVSRLCSKMEPQDPSLTSCVESLSTLLRHDDSTVSLLTSSYTFNDDTFLCPAYYKFYERG